MTEVSRQVAKRNDAIVGNSGGILSTVDLNINAVCGVCYHRIQRIVVILPASGQSRY
jgi:hypothetical protein